VPFYINSIFIIVETNINLTCIQSFRERVGRKYWISLQS